MSKSCILSMLVAFLLAPPSDAQNPSHEQSTAPKSNSCNKAKDCAKAIQKEKALIRKANQAAR